MKWLKVEKQWLYKTGCKNNNGVSPASQRNKKGHDKDFKRLPAYKRAGTTSDGSNFITKRGVLN